MKVIKSDAVEEIDATDAPIFFGGKVSRRPLVGGDASKFFSFNIVSFAAGARNKFHTHTSDQVLFVTAGRGIVATEQEEAVVREGDTILIPAGQKHWHGATPESDFSHVSLTTPDSETAIFD